MNKGQLYTFDQQIKSWNQNNNVLAELLKGRIRDFYKEHREHLDAMNENIAILKEEFFVIEDNRIVFDGEKPMLREGKTRFQFDKNWSALMAQPLLHKFKIEVYEEPEIVEGGAQ